MYKDMNKGKKSMENSSRLYHKITCLRYCWAEYRDNDVSQDLTLKCICMMFIVGVKGQKS